MILTKIPQQNFRTKVEKVEFYYEEIIEKSELFKQTLLEINKFKEILKVSKETEFMEIFNKLKDKTFELTELMKKMDSLENDL